MSGYMSNTSVQNKATQDDAEWWRGFWTRMFASGIEHARIAAGRSVEEAASLAGMKLYQWMALEAGRWLPQTGEQLWAIAGAVDVSDERMANFALFCWSAWEPS